MPNQAVLCNISVHVFRVKTEWVPQDCRRLTRYDPSEVKRSVNARSYMRWLQGMVPGQARGLVSRDAGPHTAGASPQCGEFHFKRKEFKTQKWNAKGWVSTRNKNLLIKPRVQLFMYQMWLGNVKWFKPHQRIWSFSRAKCVWNNMPFMGRSQDVRLQQPWAFWFQCLLSFVWLYKRLSPLWGRGEFFSFFL